MFKVESIVLTAVLFGYASATGCFSTYTSGGSYSAGEQVSATTVTETTTTTACTLGSTGCGSSGFKTETTTTRETYNYACKDGAASAWCSQSAFEPTGIYSGSAWNKESAQCTGSATPAMAPIPTAWTGGGCPKAFLGGTVYDADDVVSVAKTGYTMVYQCAAEPTNQFCGQAGYSPGTDQYWDVAWSELGSCTGTTAPTDSPGFNSLTDEGGCPNIYSSGNDYEEGDKVSKMGLVYQCKSWPKSQHCPQDGYEPGTSIGSGAQITEHWKDAWSVVGYCEGTITPTTSPVYVSLTDMGGCPETWSTKSDSDEYEEGDRVASQGLVYQCKAWPMSGHCGQAGYEPDTNPATPNAWKDAWTAVGFCEGSMGPTTAPLFDPANSVGACPDEWAAGTNTAYEEGDMVSVTVSTIPLRKMAYKCKAWPYSGHCGQFNPTQFGGDQGWTLAGSCLGSIGPTASPSFDKLALTDMGCPAEWSASRTEYEAGDMVSFTVSDSPERKIVYKCREWPNSGYCNQGAGFKPTTQYSDMAWTLMGACSGSMTPTAAPAPYAGVCQYKKCAMVESTETNCTPGSTSCSCRANQTAGVGCTKKVETEVCNDTDVDLWSNSVDYVTDDVVRVGTQKFKCREWPNFFWCRMEAFKPDLEHNSVWNDAWIEDDLCEIVPVLTTGSATSTGSTTAVSTVSATTTTTTTTSNPNLIDFDDLGSAYETIPNGYRGLDWDNWASTKNSIGAGYVLGMVSDPNVSVNDFGNPFSVSSKIPFSVAGFYATGVYRVDLNVLVESFDINGNTIGTYTITLGDPHDGPTPIDLRGGDFDDIFFITITSSGGTWDASLGGSGGSHLCIDDMVVVTLTF